MPNNKETQSESTFGEERIQNVDSAECPLLCNNWQSQRRNVSKLLQLKDRDQWRFKAGTERARPWAVARPP